ncbi:hypothetical protein [Spirillospora sp. NPDC029432]|uniref:hypothetical protein n=1 Tax=Spirillospora sp. NPDC029432 TaxID=3154599 RepID=UPI003452F4C6
MKHETTDPDVRAGERERDESDVRVAGPPASPTGEGGVAEAFPAPVAGTETRGETRTEAGIETRSEGHGRLLDASVADGFHERWREVQSGFVDDPRGAVRRADELAAEIVNAAGQALAARKRTLDDRLNEGGEASPDTERLRLALRDYRDFVDRTLTL